MSVWPSFKPLKVIKFLKVLTTVTAAHLVKTGPTEQMTAHRDHGIPSYVEANVALK